MRTKIRLVAIIGVVALAAFALASLPAVAQDDVARANPRLDRSERQGPGIAALDRKYEGDHASPQPIVRPDKDAKPGRTAGAPNNPSNGVDATGGFGASLVGGGSTSSSMTDRVERSLKSTADRLR